MTISHPLSRETYHHGDLRNALLAAGVRLAEVGGPEAVTVRAVAREAGVSPTAAYRHFKNVDELQGAIRRFCLEYLVDAMSTEVESLEPTDDEVADALARLKALCRGYVRMAYTEPGYFRTAFGELGSIARQGIPRRNATGYSMLVDAVDDLVTAGYLPIERRPYAEIAAWSVSHGLAHLVIDGWLQKVPDAERDAVVERALDMMVHGL